MKLLQEGQRRAEQYDMPAEGELVEDKTALDMLVDSRPAQNELVLGKPALDMLVESMPVQDELAVDKPALDVLVDSRMSTLSRGMVTKDKDPSMMDEYYNMMDEYYSTRAKL